MEIQKQGWVIDREREGPKDTKRERERMRETEKERERDI